MALLLASPYHAMRLACALLVAGLAQVARAQTLLTEWPEPNGPVHAIVEDTAQGVVFIGGGFDRIGPPIRGGVPLDRATGQPVLDALSPNGLVLDVLPDGNGGHYMAGDLTEVDGQARSRIAHIGANGQLLPFNPSASAGLNGGTVTKLLLQDGVLYVVHSVNSSTQVTTRGYAGAVDATTAEPLWERGLTDRAILDAIPDGQGGWYIAGEFMHVGGQRREGIARIAANGAVHPWDLQVNGTVNRLHLAGDTLYFSGCFGSVMGEDRQYLAAVLLSGNTLLPLQTDFGTSFGLPCATPSHIFRLGARLYVRGGFEFMSNFAFQNEGWLDATTGAAATVPFVTDERIDDLLQTEDRVLVAGSFTLYNGVPQSGLAIIDRTNYALVPGQLIISGGGVHGLEEGDGVIYLRGAFTAINGQPRTGLAAIDANTLELLPWAPQLNGVVNAFTFGEGVLHLRGSFNTVDGMVRSGAAAVNAAGALLGWSPMLGSQGSPGGVFERQGDRVLMALPQQSTTSPGSHRVFALDASSGEPTGWQVQVAGGTVTDLLLDDDHLFLAGSFQSLQGQPRACLGRVALSNASLDAWDAQIIGSSVGRIEPAGDRLFVAGSFTSIGGQARSRLALLSRSTAQPDPQTFSFGSWGQSSSATITDMRAVGDTLYLAGTFNSVNGVSRYNCAALSISSGVILPWRILNFDQGQMFPVFMALAVSGDTVFLGGSFRSLMTIESQGLVESDRYHIAAVDRHTGVMLDSLSRVYGIPTGIRAIGDKLFVRGVSLLGGVVRSAVAALNATDGTLTPFQLDVQGEVHALALSDGALYLGGPFNAVNGVPVPGVARVNALTGALLPFVQPITWGGERYALQVHQGRLFMGTASGLSVHDAETGVALTWPHLPNGRIRALDLLGDHLYIGGSFSLAGSVARAGAAAVDLSQDLLLPWAPGGQISCLSASTDGIAVIVANGMLLAVDPDLGQALPVVRPFSDTGLPGATVVAAEGDLLIMASGNPVLTDSYMSRTESYHLPTGGRTTFSLSYASWSLVENDFDVSDNAFVANMLLSPGRLIVGGQFMTIGGRRRHNLAVFERPVQPLVRIDIRAALGGVSQELGLMHDSLRAQGLLPAQEPYTELGFEQRLFGGGEAADGPVFASADSSAVVDWVLVELRSASDPAEVLATRNGLLRRDGRVVDVDGRIQLTFPLPAGAYHVALRHRNHLGVMSAAPLTLSSAATLVDLRASSTDTYGTDARMPLGNGYALWPGDATGDGVVKYTGSANDRDAVLQRIGGSTPSAVVSGVYDMNDVNLDGAVKYAGANNDRDIILQTIGGTVPTAVRVEQVP